MISIKNKNKNSDNRYKVIQQKKIRRKVQPMLPSSSKEQLSRKMPIFPNFPQKPSRTDPNFVETKYSIDKYEENPVKLIYNIADLVSTSWNSLKS